MSIDNSKFLFCFCTFVNDASHMEMVCAIVHQLTRSLTQEQIRSGGFSTYFINHTTGNFPCDANGMPFSAATLQVTGDPVTEVHEDLAAEQKARTTYDNSLRMTDGPERPASPAFCLKIEPSPKIPQRFGAFQSAWVRFLVEKQLRTRRPRPVYSVTIRFFPFCFARYSSRSAALTQSFHRRPGCPSPLQSIIPALNVTGIGTMPRQLSSSSF